MIAKVAVDKESLAKHNQLPTESRDIDADCLQTRTHRAVTRSQFDYYVELTDGFTKRH